MREVTITTYRHRRLPHAREFPSRMGSNYFHVSHIADRDHHIHYRGCVEQLGTVDGGGPGHARDLHLGGRSHIFASRPHK